MSNGKAILKEGQLSAVEVTAVLGILVRTGPEFPLLATWRAVVDTDGSPRDRATGILAGLAAASGGLPDASDRAEAGALLKRLRRGANGTPRKSEEGGSSNPGASG